MGAAKSFLDAWSDNAMRSCLESVKKVFKMRGLGAAGHETGLLNYSRYRITNACAKGFNSAIQFIEANARGFRNFTRYRARILFRCGKLGIDYEHSVCLIRLKRIFFKKAHSVSSEGIVRNWI